MKFSQFHPNESHVLLQILDFEVKGVPDAKACPQIPPGFAIGRQVDHEGERGAFVFLERAAAPFPLVLDGKKKGAVVLLGQEEDFRIFALVPRSAIVGHMTLPEPPKVLTATLKAETQGVK